jgi:hypothetical protein
MSSYLILFNIGLLDAGREVGLEVNTEEIWN